jgi:CDP-diacylglycerol--glycerol-3-phosphate 3-phosphatidyltransferase
MNWANRLTVGRFFLSLIFVVSLNSNWGWGRTVGLVVFLLAGISDYADGQIARRYSLVTDFGKLMDPLMDKIMIASAFICLVPFKAIPAWVVVLIVSREFAITGLRLLALTNGKLLAAESLGKHKTAWQIITIIFFLLMLSISELSGFEKLGSEPGWFNTVWIYGGNIFLTIAVTLTLVSGLGYLWKNHAVIKME